MTARSLTTVGAVLLASMVATATGSKLLHPWKSRPRLIYNVSGSAPLGFYWIDFAAPKRGDLVVIRPSADLSTFMSEHDILPIGAVLLKTVVALAGDEICHDRSVLIVNGRASAKLLHTDAQGRSLPAWQGCRKLVTGEIFVLQPHQNSFDSRYFGPVQEREVVGVARSIRAWSLADPAPIQ